MKRTITLALVALFALAGGAQAQEPKTFFDYLESAYVVGRLNAAPPLKYRDETLLVFTTKVLDILHARIGKPQTLMIVEELHAKGDASPITPDTPFLAPVILLPEHAYWRDNLPNTPRHQIAGGTRYIFTGAQIAEVEKFGRPFAATLERNYAERWPDRSDTVVAALSSPLDVLREDGARYLVAHPVLFSNMRDATRERLSGYLTGDAPIEFRQSVVEAMGESHAEQMTPILEELARRDDTVGAAALHALERSGKAPDIHALLNLSRAESVPVRAYAAEALGARASEDSEAFARAAALLAPAEPEQVRAAAAVGLGKSRNPQAIEPLRVALEHGGETARPTASAIAEIGGPKAADILKKAVVDGTNESKTAAVVAIIDLQEGCADCQEFLRTQYESNPDKGIRQLIGIMLELNRKHEH
jgi:hypothetical protein